MTSHQVSMCPRLGLANNNVREKDKKKGGTPQTTKHSTHLTKLNKQVSPLNNTLPRLIDSAFEFEQFPKRLICVAFRCDEREKGTTQRTARCLKKQHTHTHRHSTHSPFFPHRLYGSNYRSILSKPLIKMVSKTSR